MAFTVHYTDDTITEYDEKTKWTIEDGVLKMGAVEGQWTFLVSPAHWKTINTDPPEPRSAGATVIR